MALMLLKSTFFLLLYFSVFIPLFLVLIGQYSGYKMIQLKVKKKRADIAVTNELIKSYVGRHCVITTGSFGGAVSGQIINVCDNWMEICTSKDSQLINIDFITNIRELPIKKKKAASE